MSKCLADNLLYEDLKYKVRGAIFKVYKVFWSILVPAGWRLNARFGVKQLVGIGW